MNRISTEKSLGILEGMGPLASAEFLKTICKLGAAENVSFLTTRFEHEVSHSGDKRRVVLTVDCLHPDLTREGSGLPNASSPDMASTLKAMLA